jgi:hypothetical protein
VVLTFPPVATYRPAWADDEGDSDALQVTLDRGGLLVSVSTDGFDTGSSNGFFENLGTNGRTCGTCHVVTDAWTFTPEHAQALAPNDPLFTPNDGSDCPPTSPSEGPNRALSSEVLNYGLIRIQLGIPRRPTSRWRARPTRSSVRSPQVLRG